MSATLGFVATLAEMEQFYRGDKAGQIIELMNKTNDIMDDVPLDGGQPVRRPPDAHPHRPARRILAPPLSGHAARQVPVEPGQGRLRHP